MQAAIIAEARTFALEDALRKLMEQFSKMFRMDERVEPHAPTSIAAEAAQSVRAG
jgi:hypothetical protein